MSSKDKDNNTFNKLKQFFRISKTSGATHRDRNYFPISAELERELQPETPVGQRCKALKDFSEDVIKYRLEVDAVQTLWLLTKDLIVGNKSTEQRHVALNFYCKLIKGQYDNLKLMRAQFFRVIVSHEEPEDIAYRLEMLKSLTENGKNIQYFEKEIGSFLVQWIPQIDQAGLIVPLLELIVNLVKYNAASLEKNFLVGIVNYIFDLTCRVEDTQTILLSLTVLDCLPGYAIIPNEILTLFIVILCRTVNREAYCQTSWKIMKNLFGTALGHATLLTMCNILNDRTFYRDEALLRGAIFHTNMGLWGVSGSAILNCPPSIVLTSFWNALKSEHVVVTFEVILSIHRLIQKSGPELNEPTWDIICDIMTEISSNLARYRLPNDNHVVRNFHETLDLIEDLLQRNDISADPEKIYGLIEKVSSERPEASVRRLIEYMTTKISATRPEWLLELCSFMDRFYKMKGTMIRIYAVQALVKIMNINRAAYEEEILDRIVMVHLAGVVHEMDPEVRTAVAGALITFIRHCDTKRCLELLEIVGKMLQRPYDWYAQDRRVVHSVRDVEDVIVLVDGLIEIFGVKLYRLPSAHAIRVFHLLLRQLELHYEKPMVFQRVNVVRYNIFKWMLKARANASFHVGYPESDKSSKIRFSLYLGVEGPFQHQSTQPPQSGSVAGQGQSSSQLNLAQQQDGNAKAADAMPSAGLTTISIKRGCQIIVDCLREEKDWEVIQLVLSELPNIMENKALIQGNDVDSLAKTLFRMFNDRMLTDKLIFYSSKPTQTDIHDLVLPVLASLATYHQHLEFLTKKNIIDALKNGLISRRPQICIQTLTVLLLEMPDPLVSKLTDLLFELSKMTNTTTVAVPVLEFLSTLSHLPSDRIANFRVVEYMYVLAMSFPYTNPYRYDHYTVSLAHHVIAGWFLKCRLPMRKNLVYYIVKGLESYVHTPFQDGSKPRADFSQVNEDSSNRKRSSSLTEQGSKRRGAGDRAAIQQAQQAQQKTKPNFNSDLYNFHSELAETCIDFLANHTYSPCSGLAKRSPAAEFLLRGGQSNTWLVGHNLITITTSGCSAIPLRNGLCDRCFTMCKDSKAPGTAAAAASAAEPSTGLTAVAAESSASSASLNKDSGVVVAGSGAAESGQGAVNKSANESDSTDLTTTSSSTSSLTPAAVPPSSGNATTHTGHGGNRFFRQGSQEGGYSSSSLETLSRRGSNPDPTTTAMVDNGSTEQPPAPTLTSKKTEAAPAGDAADKPIQLCACSCTGWAEICIRRPTGVLSWMMRVQNQINYDQSMGEFPLQDLTTLFVPSLGGGIVGADFLGQVVPTGGEKTPAAAAVMASGDELDPAPVVAAQIPPVSLKATKVSISDEVFEIRKDEESSDMGDDEDVLVEPAESGVGAGSGPIDIPRHGVVAEDANEDEDDVEFDDPEGRSRNPVRRVNSSPEMSSNWKNQFLNKINSKDGEGYEGPMESEGQQKKKNYGKGVSCEAIPEEIAGSTPPSGSKTITPALPSDSLTVRASGNVKQQPDFTTSGATLHPSASLPESSEAEPSSSTAPKKQHSADDAITGGRLDANSSSTETIASPAMMMTPITQTLSSSSLNLKLPMEKITTKPPQSPAPLSPRLLARNAINGKLSNSGTASPAFPAISGAGTMHSASNENDFPRGRSKTISVAREHYSRDNLKWGGYNKSSAQSRLRGEQPGGGGAASRSVISPSFVFLQLFHSGQLNTTEKPILMDKDASERAIHLLDLIAPFEKHKIGVLYVGPSQAGNETEILKNRFGSLRYAKFLRKLGTLVAIKEAKEQNFFIDLECNGKDGNFTYIWQDDIVQVTFHVATLMPNHRHDPNCNEKKKHIGNDFVSIVYNESGEPYDLKTIKGQFNYACVVIEPMELDSNRVFVLARDEIAQHVCSKSKIVSDASAPLLARQMALHANLASLVSQSLKIKNQNPYASNWLERLRKIKNIRAKAASSVDPQEQQAATGGGAVRGPGGSVGSAQDLTTASTTRGDDFTVYTQ